MTIPSESGAQHMGLFWMLRLDRALPAAPEPRLPATMQPAGPEIAGELAAVMGLDDPALVLQRFQQGRQCHIARIEDRIASYGWITFDEERIGERAARVERDFDEIAVRIVQLRTLGIGCSRRRGPA